MSAVVAGDGASLPYILPLMTSVSVESESSLTSTSWLVGSGSSASLRNVSRPETSAEVGSSSSTRGNENAELWGVTKPLVEDIEEDRDNIPRLVHGMLRALL